ncbi:hypothetical protein Mpop_5464 (plasmid) [Methylorubrum populi BJ001]|uniref:Gene transfer agent family protein n=1 Tax=Methylorubrum populi (strain ATCC BAA-705 / NCIMB 13946 / BJ001) TaxID=441620 RepID=B1ZM80_METPB|nr:gene transfer agent family protein [Methylorubrum populi]ACB83553.1 hypothetical protein Mpop_5464 [Methylorubrum populi BJ001]
MSRTAHVAFFGDHDHTFDLAKPELIRELENLTGVGIGALVGRVIETRTFFHADLEAVLRLGLIGGGVHPKPAAHLVETYLPLMPLAEVQTIAIGTLAALWFGVKPTPEHIVNEETEQ